MKLGKLLKNSKPKWRSSMQPVWKGPRSSSSQGGITQSLMTRFMTCRERFRLYVIEGLKPISKFNHLLEYGSLWHECEENHAAGRDFLPYLQKSCNDLLLKYKQDQQQINKWYNCCKLQFPIYVRYWLSHEKDLNVKYLMQEESFKVKYKTPGGAEFYLRGKWDGVVKIDDEVYLDEHKTKSEIDRQKITTQLRGGDNQTMMYLTALGEWAKHGRMRDKEDVIFAEDIAGVRYNLIKRPLSGGKGTIKMLKGSKNRRPETPAAYYARLAGIIEENADNFFAKFTVEVSKQEVRDYKKKTLNGLLCQIDDWYEWVTSPEGRKDPFANPIHWQHPTGIYNPVNEGRMSDIDNYIMTGNATGLEEVETLFPELE